MQESAVKNWLLLLSWSGNKFSSALIGWHHLLGWICEWCSHTFLDSKTVNRSPALMITILTNQFAVTKVHDAVAASDRFKHLHLTPVSTVLFRNYCRTNGCLMERVGGYYGICKNHILNCKSVWRKYIYCRFGRALPESQRNRAILTGDDDGELLLNLTKRVFGVAYFSVVSAI
jgi:hypothetical protein